MDTSHTSLNKVQCITISQGVIEIILVLNYFREHSVL